MQKPILLNNLLHMSEEDINRTKVKFNLTTDYNGGGKSQLEQWLCDPDLVNSHALFWIASKRTFKVNEIAISLVKMPGDAWLLTTIKVVTQEFGVTYNTNYVGKELSVYQPYFGRVIVKYHKSHQNAVLRADGIFNELEVQQILPNVYNGEDITGYDRVRF